ncbi:ABC-F family ATP-binding cassette domain-containing protein [Clostridium ganghwense]|uniref:ABC-F family ATP-binding cassette domain-containing protein n=1 Tax=Clostridium ganghwense TaxID=312089 RepID=A0ABT4CLZ6_9CLOT|nr:ABC-F family ATP-binding cassette domain-containing protein [Clostridium ganghwense]MCY6369493.1 ABC-F family ATP-binding cassette domain-containing protein [Clostridium ganghwense]
MNLISLENISKSYGEKVLLKDISVIINEGEKIGLIGINGTGKSTLLKVIAGIENYDDGKITKASKLRIEYLSQNAEFDDDAKVIEQIFKGNSPIMKLLRDYENTIEKLENNSEDNRLQKKLLELNEKMDAANAWEIESQAKIVLTQLGIRNFDAKVGTLSGGQRKRIALAGALISPCDLLILDEPTNHMDNETVKWLEEYLNSRKGALIMITHDRYFLDRVTNRMLELNNGKLYSYTGNYSVFLEAKAEREAFNEAAENKRQNLLRRELAWIKRGAKARSTKQKARIDRFNELASQEIEKRNEKVEISVGSTRLGKKVINLNNICKRFEDKKLIDDFNFIFKKEDRIGIIGANGIGKSTLLNIINDKIKPDSGTIEIGETVKIGYFSQEYKNIDESMRAIEYVKEGAEFIKTEDGTSISASRMMERFLFTPEIQWTHISRLSGGEKRRLYLLRVLMEAPNVLILDEPTNDLDIETLNVLEEYIEQFNGTVIAVSHDRYFLDKTANEIISFKGNGVIEKFTGNYSEYMEFLQKQGIEDEHSDKVSKNSKNDNKNTKNSEKPKSNKSLKFSYKEKLEYEQIDGWIEETEIELEEVKEKINSAGCDYTILQELLEKQKELEDKLDNLMERWTYLNELAEKINM